MTRLRHFTTEILQSTAVTITTRQWETTCQLVTIEYGYMNICLGVQLYTVVYVCVCVCMYVCVCVRKCVCEWLSVRVYVSVRARMCVTVVHWGRYRAHGYFKQFSIIRHFLKPLGTCIFAFFFLFFFRNVHFSINSINSRVNQATRDANYLFNLK